MKNMKLLISLVLVMTMCVVMLAGCSSRPSTGTKTDWEDPAKPTGTTPDNSGKTDWEDPVNPSQPAQPSQPDETGKYRHEIDGIVFYTEHDVEQWIERIPGGRNIFHMDQMVKEIFGDDAMAGNGRAMFHGNQYFEFGNTNLNGSSNDYPEEGYYPYLSISVDTIYDMGPISGDKDYYLPIYYFSNEDNKLWATDYELIEISLYACEMWAKNETSTYAFENFKTSMRFMIVHR